MNFDSEINKFYYSVKYHIDTSKRCTCRVTVFTYTGPRPDAPPHYKWFYLHTWLLQGHTAYFRHMPDISLLHAALHVAGSKMFQEHACTAVLNTLLAIYTPLSTLFFVFLFFILFISIYCGARSALEV